jgi:basic membrane protein A
MNSIRKYGFVSLIILTILSVFLAGCGQNNQGSEQEADDASPQNNLKIGMVTDIGGVNDNSFNQSAWEGIQRLSDESGSQVDYLQSQSDADYVPNLNQFVKNGWSLTWGIGFMMGDAIKQVAEANPDAKLAIIDAVVEAPNVASVVFKEHEGSYLVGAVAGLMTKTNKVGFVGGMEIPVIKRFEAGFIAGVKATNPNAKVIVNYTGAFNAPDQGKATAATIYNNGADIIFHAAGSTGDGVFNEAKERAKGGAKIWVIGVDKDQSKTFGHDVTLTSMMKRVDEAVYLVSNNVVKGEFKGGDIRSLGLAENGVGLPGDNPNIPQDVLDKVAGLQQQIINGEITVPTE